MRGGGWQGGDRRGLQLDRVGIGRPSQLRNWLGGLLRSGGAKRMFRCSYTRDHAAHRRRGELSLEPLLEVTRLAGWSRGGRHGLGGGGGGWDHLRGIGKGW